MKNTLLTTSTPSNLQLGRPGPFIRRDLDLKGQGSTLAAHAEKKDGPRNTSTLESWMPSKSIQLHFLSILLCSQDLTLSVSKLKVAHPTLLNIPRSEDRLHFQRKTRHQMPSSTPRTRKQLLLFSLPQWKIHHSSSDGDIGPSS